MFILFTSLNILILLSGWQKTVILSKNTYFVHDEPRWRTGDKYSVRDSLTSEHALSFTQHSNSLATHSRAQSTQSSDPI